METTRGRSVADEFAPPPWPKNRREWKPILYGILITAFIGFAFFFYGLMRWNAMLHQEQLSHVTDVQRLQLQLTQTQSENSLLRARGDLFQAQQQLDQRNFGSANDELKSAAAQLQKVNPQAAGVDANQLQQVKQSLATFNVQVAVDFEQQRERLLTLTQKLDAIVPK